MTPFEQIGGEDVVRRVVLAFYAHMAEHEVPLARLHRLDEQQKIHADAQERFALFLIGWLGGPMTYMERFGHPRLRIRHAHVTITQEMRDAWMRSMVAALDEVGVTGDIRQFMEAKLGDVADFLRS